MALGKVKDRDREPFPGKSRIHALIRGFDWDASSFGRPESWPKSLRSVVALMLDCSFPMCLSWGPGLNLLYNDAYLPIAGAKHPGALGARMQDVWAQLWPAMEPIVRQALAGRAGLFQNFPVDGAGAGQPARRWFDFSCTPVRDDDDRIAGVLCIGTETTEQVLTERHHAFQLRLSDRLRGLAEPEEISAHASRQLGLHLGVARVGYLKFDEAKQVFSACADWTSGELLSLRRRILPIEEFGAEAVGQLRMGRTLKLNDSAVVEDCAPFLLRLSQGARAMLAVPLIKNGGLCAVLHLARRQVHQWSEDEIVLAQETAERIWAAVERAHADQRRRAAERELVSNAARQAFQLELSDLLRPLSDPEIIVETASSLLGRHLGVSRVLYAEVDDAKGIFEVRRDWTRPGVSSVAGRFSRLDDFGPEIIGALRSGIPVAVGDILEDARTAPHADAYASVQVRSFLTVPLVKSGSLHTVLILHREAPSQWNETDLQRAQDMVERTWASLEAARAEAALRSERYRSMYVLDSMAEGFTMLGPDCSVLQMNSEGLRICRLALADVVGRKAGDVWPKARGTSLAELYKQVKVTGKAAALEFRRTLPDGRESWLEVRAFPVIGGGVAVFYRDIAERKLVEQKLKIADRRKDEFVATLAHELRNPIAPIAAAANVLTLPGLDMADARRAGEIILRQVGNMTALVNELLDISRVTSGLIDLHPSELNINDIVPEAVEQVEPTIRSRGHQLTIHLSDEPARTWGDRHRLVQVLANLLNNAARYTPNGGSIVLQVQAQEDYVAISVRDNGIGMAPDLVESAFELFAQAQRTDRNEGGLGIGLALVKGIVELHGGTVTAHSEGVGRGSEFRVLLPRMAERESRR